MQKTSSFQTILVDGGLDLISSKVGISPGSCSDNYNYEIAITEGMRRREGYERFDGGVSPSFTRVSRIRCENYNTGLNSFNIGQECTMYNGPYAGYIDCIVINRELDEPNDAFYLWVVFATPEASEQQKRVWPIGAFGMIPTTNTIRNANPLDLSVALLTHSYGYVADASGLGTVADNITARIVSYNTTRLQVQQVPGQGSVIGLAWFKDFAYAVRDYYAMNVSQGESEPVPGAYLYQGTFGSETAGGYVAKVVTQTGSWAGSPDNTAIAKIMLYDVVGTFAAGNIRNHNTGDLVVAAFLSTGIPAEAAGLYKATGERGTTPSTGSWKHQDLSWNVTYRDGADDFLPLTPTVENIAIKDLIQTTDWKYPQSIVSAGQGGWSPSSGGTVNDIPNMIDEDPPDYDGTYVRKLVTNTAPMGAIAVNNFGFTDNDIPEGSYITGLEVQAVKRVFRAATATVVSVVDDGCGFVGLGNDSGQQFGNTTTFWNNSTTDPDTPNWGTSTYGGKQQLFGLTNVTPAKIKDSAFGLRFGSKANAITGTMGATTARVTQLRVRAHYLPQASKIYFWNGSTAVVADVVQAYPQSGSTAGGDAQGILYLTGVTTGRRIGANEEIRTYPATPGVAPDGGAADGSTLIAKTNTRAEKNVMDWEALLSDTTQKAQPRVSKYEHFVHNFYAASGLEALFMMSGGGPATFYDGTNFSRILTGLTSTAEKPRHGVAHQGRLFLGYESGLLQWSDATSPLSWDATLAASARASGLGMGSPVNGLYSLNGDALAVFTRDNVKMIQGNVNDTPYESIIQPKIGAIEYTCQSAGAFMFLSFLGLTTLESVRDYGDFKPAGHSEMVWPYLRPRVQSSAYFESVDTGADQAYAVKNKGQLRLLFRDGDVLFATFLHPGELPKFTKHFYVDNGGERIVWSVMCTGTETRGRDRIFGAVDDESGWVYELDRGVSDDGAAIDAFFTLSVFDLKSPFLEKRWTDIHLHGLAQDYAAISVRRAANYDDFSDSGQTVGMIFGTQTGAPTGVEKPYFSKNNLAREGRFLAVKFQSASESEFPHCIQAVILNVDPLQEART